MPGLFKIFWPAVLVLKLYCLTFQGKKAPPTPKKMATTANSEVNFQGVIDLKAYHARLDEWSMEIIEMIDKELGQRVLSPEGSELEDTRMMTMFMTDS